MARHLPILLSVLLSSAFVPEAAAQGRAEPAPITFSVAGGFNLSRLSFTFDVLDEIPGDLVEVENGSRIGLVAGGLVDFRVARGASVLTGGLFSTRGGKRIADVADLGTVEVDLRMIYVDVPAFVAVALPGGGANRFELLGGVMVGIQADATMTISGLGLSFEEDFPGDLPDIDFGLSVGGRYTRGHIFGAAYYTWGLTDLSQGGPQPIRHQYLTVLGGWRF